MIQIIPDLAFLPGGEKKPPTNQPETDLKNTHSIWEYLMNEAQLVCSCSSCQDHAVFCANRVRDSLCLQGFAFSLKVKCEELG